MDAVSQEYAERGRLRILQLTAPAEFGGLETVVAQLSAGLVSRGYAMCVGCVLDDSIDPGSHPLVRVLDTSGVPVKVIQVRRRAYGRERAAIGSLIAEFEPTVIHTHGYRSDVIGGRAALEERVPRVATAHGFTHGGWKNLVYEYLQRRSYRNAEAIIAVSRPLAARLSEDGSVAPRVHVIRNALSRRRDRPGRTAARARLGIETDGFVVGWLGRMGEEKGPDVVVRAMADPRAAELNLCMVGDGPLRTRLESDSVSSPGARVHWPGAIPDAGRLIAAFDVVVLSSRTEGTPMVLLEAMDAGVPMVATRVGGIPDMVNGDEALLVAPDEPEALLTAVLEVANDRVAALSRSARAEERLATQYDLKTWLDAHESVYRSVAADAAGGET
ncbi:MAG: glycosyltransferase family 4 protein [Gemmatimonadota bacterium]